MPFYFTCPYCFKKTLVSEELAGESGPCAGCGKEVTVPAVTPNKPAENTQPVGSKYVPSDTNHRGEIGERPSQQWKAWVLRGLGTAVLMGVLTCISLYVFWPVFQGLRARRNAIACMNNLQLIALALDAYAQDHGTYPPPVVYDAKGKAMHSWRVLILNYLGHESLYAQYRFEEPWDAPSNALLLSQCPSVYISPAAGDPNASESNYWLVTGNNTVFPKSGPLRPSQITDGLDRTLIVVEVQNGAHEWTKPIDIDFGRLNPRIGAQGANAIGGNHSDGAAAAFANGDPAWLPADLEPTLLDAIISPAGDEPVEPSDFQYK